MFTEAFFQFTLLRCVVQAFRHDILRNNRGIHPASVVFLFYRALSNSSDNTECMDVLVLYTVTTKDCVFSCAQSVGAGLPLCASEAIEKYFWYFATHPARVWETSKLSGEVSIENLDMCLLFRCSGATDAGALWSSPRCALTLTLKRFCRNSTHRASLINASLCWLGAAW